jgi:hypothetical protein
VYIKSNAEAPKKFTTTLSEKAKGSARRFESADLIGVGAMFSPETCVRALSTGARLNLVYILI